MSTLPLILLPGVGTDERVFALQRMEFPELIVPEWIPPVRRESLADYAARFAAHINPGGPCIIGGMSFGGMLALELTRHLPARGCVMISSIKSRKELPPLARFLGPGSYLLPPRTDRWVRFFGRMLSQAGPLLPANVKSLCVHMAKTESPLIPWAWQAIISWKSSREPWPCPVAHLHGDRDPVLPARWTKPDQLVPGGGHLLTLTHPFVVNEWLREQMERFAANGQ